MYLKNKFLMWVSVSVRIIATIDWGGFYLFEPYEIADIDSFELENGNAIWFVCVFWP